MMKPQSDTMNLNPDKVRQLKTLLTILTKAKRFHAASVRVVHNFSQYQWERDFTFEALDAGKGGCMRGRGGTIQRGDHIVLRSGSDVARYQVDEIDYDAQLSDQWVALLHPCSGLVADRRFWMGPAAELTRSCSEKAFSN